MKTKKELLARFAPIAVLKAITPEAKRAVPQAMLVDDMVPLRSFPFRVGRESRVKMVEGRVERTERVQERRVEPTNDLYLIDESAEINISREHLQIEKDGYTFYLNDRGSEYGTIVAGEYLTSGDGSDTVRLNDGDTVTLGRDSSQYIYQFIILQDI